MNKPSPRLGFFWFVPSTDGSRLIAHSVPFDDVPEIGGFRTVELGHYEYWLNLGRSDPLARAAAYEDYPRGRVNYIASDDRFLLLLDVKLKRPPFIDRLIEAFALPRERLKVALDSHYRSRRQPEDRP